MITILNKLIFVALCASVLCALLIARDYEDQKHANAAKLSTAIAEARAAEHAAAANVNIQRAVLQQEVSRLMPTLPATALQEIRTRPR